jgi:hypothetical protein
MIDVIILENDSFLYGFFFQQKQDSFFLQMQHNTIVLTKAKHTPPYNAICFTINIALLYTSSLSETVST